jgi:hypothetical protein
MTFQKARRMPWRPDRPSAAIETHWRRRERVTPRPASVMTNHIARRLSAYLGTNAKAKAALLRRD